MVQKKQLIYPDILRILASFCVIIIHVSTLTYTNMSIFGNHTWWISNIYSALSRWSVPVFFMISGMFLLNKTETLKEVLTKRLFKITIPFIAWGFIYNYYKFLYGGNSSSILQWCKQIISGDVYYHYWFLYCLLGSYLILPFLRLLVKNASDSELRYFLILWLIEFSLVPLLWKFFEIQISLRLINIANFAGFLVAGYFLSKVEFDKRLRTVLYILGIVCFVITVTGTYQINIRSYVLDQFFYDNSTFTTIIESFAIFVFFKQINFEKMGLKCRNIITTLSACTFGIYLVHPIVRNEFFQYDYFVQFYQTFPKSIGILLFSLIIFIISLLITKIISSIPFLKKII